LDYGGKIIGHVSSQLSDVTVNQQRDDDGPADATIDQPLIFAEAVEAALMNHTVGIVLRVSLQSRNRISRKSRNYFQIYFT